MNGRWQWFGVLALVMACTGDGATAPSPTVTYDNYVSGRWSYRYIKAGYSEGLDSVAGSLILALARPPSDSAVVSATQNVVGYFWGVTTGDTARGTALIWPAGYISRGRYAVQDSVLRLVTMQPSTFLNREKAMFQRAGVDTLYYVWGEVEADWSISLIIQFVRAH